MNERDKDIELLDFSVEKQSNSDSNQTNNSTISSTQNVNISNVDSFSKPIDVISSVTDSSSENSASSNVSENLEKISRHENSDTDRDLSLLSSSSFDNESRDFHSEKEEKKDLDTSNNLNNSKPTKPIVFLIIFIILLLVIIFLPYIGEFFDSLFPKKEGNVTNTGISSGSLVCTLEYDNNGVSYYYTDTYDFENRKIKNLQHVVSIQGGTDFLNQRNIECQTIKQTADSLPGISIECNLSSGEMVETQYFDFSSLKGSDVSTAFIEAGGIYPNVKYNENVFDVERNLTISGYKCRQS